MFKKEGTGKHDCFPSHPTYIDVTLPYLHVHTTHLHVPYGPYTLSCTGPPGIERTCAATPLVLVAPSLVGMRVETKVLRGPYMYMYFGYHGYSVEPSCPGNMKVRNVFVALPRSLQRSKPEATCTLRNSLLRVDIAGLFREWWQLGKAGTAESGRGCQCGRERESLNRVRAGVRVDCRGSASPALRVCMWKQKQHLSDRTTHRHDAWQKEADEVGGGATLPVWRWCAPGRLG